MPLRLRLLLLDNRDSFVWNLAQAFGTLGAAVEVVRSDAIDAVAVGRRAADGIVISPGPGRPEDAGCAVDVVRALGGRVPILGVCLGHQAIACAFGARVDRSPPCHGKAWTIRHRDEGLFEGLPDPITAARYHSLSVIESTLPACLRADAWTPEGELMSIRHREHPTYGLQFHPESFRTERGAELLARFLEAAA